MFPISKIYQQRFRIEGNEYYQNIQNILNKHEKQIISDCQKYLDKYENEGKPKYAVDLDLLINLINNI